MASWVAMVMVAGAESVGEHPRSSSFRLIVKCSSRVKCGVDLKHTPNSATLCYAATI